MAKKTVKRKKKVKAPKRKRVRVQFIECRHAGQVVECYAICERLIAECRPDLKEVKIGFAWNVWRADADGRRQAGQCEKRKDLDRELDSYDFIIQLNKETWPTYSDTNKERLIFHELEHAQVVNDKNGRPMKDDRGRIVTRIKRHDIEEFTSVIERYGSDPGLLIVAAEDIADAQRPLLAECEKRQAGKGRAERPSMAAAVAAGEKTFDKAVQKTKKRQHTVGDLKK